MGKYLLLWEVDKTRLPVDRTERAQGMSALMALTKQDLDKGLALSWGAFIGETSGYAIYEGSEVDIMKAVQQYIPFASYTVKPLATLEQVNEMLADLSA